MYLIFPLLFKREKEGEEIKVVAGTRNGERKSEGRERQLAPIATPRWCRGAVEEINSCPSKA